MNAETEKECAEGATAPRVSLDDIEWAISNHFFLKGDDVDALSQEQHAAKFPSLRVLTICLLVMRNGFTVIGKAAPASSDNFNAELDRKLAYEDAIRKLWPLMGY